MFYIIQSQDTLAYIHSISSDEVPTCEWTYDMQEAVHFNTMESSLFIASIIKVTLNPVILCIGKVDSSIWCVCDCEGRKQSTF